MDEGHEKLEIELWRECGARGGGVMGSAKETSWRCGKRVLEDSDDRVGKPMKTTAAGRAIERNGCLERCGDGGSEAGVETGGRRGVEARGKRLERGRGDEEAM